MSFIWKSQQPSPHSGCVNMRLGSVCTRGLLFVRRMNSCGGLFIVWLGSAFSHRILRFFFGLISRWYCLVESGTEEEDAAAQGYLQRYSEGGGGGGEVLSRIELILHQVSSISWGSGSQGKYSPGTRRRVCTAGPRGGFYGMRRPHSRPASRLQTETHRVQASTVCNRTEVCSSELESKDY